MSDPTTGPAKTGEYGACISIEGAYDLSGNVHEWTSSRGHLSNGKDKYVLKGGSYLSPKFQSRCSSFREESPQFAHQDIGFRCCKDL